MNVILWILQIFLAAAFLAHGIFYLFPPADMVVQMNAIVPPAFRIVIGAAEVLAAIGLTLPGMTRIHPWLVSAAAVGLMMVTGSATVFHTVRAETSPAIATAFLFVLSSVLAYMRWKVAPIAPGTAVRRRTTSA